MAPTQPFPNSPGNYPLLALEVAFGQNWNAASPTWTDITAYVLFRQGLSWARGRQDDTGQFQPGRISGTLDNKDRRFDPTYTSGPYYGNLIEGTPCRLTAYWPDASTGYVQFLGIIETWDAKWDLPVSAVCDFDGPDFLGALSLYAVPSQYFMTTTAQARLAAIANLAGVPAGYQNFAAGKWPLGNEALHRPVDVGPPADALQLMQQVADGQTQLLYVTRGGTVTSANNWGTVPGVAGGTFGAGGYPLHHLSVSVSSQYFYTMVQFTPNAGTINNVPVGGTPVYASVAAYPMPRYGTRVLTRQVSAMSTANAQSAVQQYGSVVLGRRSADRPATALVRPAAQGGSAWPTILQCDFGTCFLYKVVSPGSGGTVSRKGFVEQIEHKIGAADWVVSLTNSDGTGGTLM